MGHDPGARTFYVPGKERHPQNTHPQKSASVHTLCAPQNARPYANLWPPLQTDTTSPRPRAAALGVQAEHRLEMEPGRGAGGGGERRKASVSVLAAEHAPPRTELGSQ